MSCALRPLMAIVLLGVALTLPAAQQDRRRAEQDLRALTERLTRVERQVAQDGVEKDRKSRDLRDAERSVASARGSLRELQSQRSERAAARQKLVEQREATEAERRRNLDDLARQLRSAYFMGRNEPLKLLLNQRSSGEISRNLTYYGYFGRMRATLIGKLDEDLVKIAELTSKIETEEAELARLERRQKEQLGELDNARQQRGIALATFEKESRSRAAQLANLKRQKQQVEDLVRRLSRATESFPYDPNSPFARRRGQLAWPVAGRISTDFGVARGDARSDGIEIETQRGADVRAVHEGRVDYADWLPGRGLFVLVSHGSGYISMYGHAEQLFKQKGDVVKAGEVIATAGDSGGRSSPGLYFEMRQGRTPVNPHLWFSTRVPPAR